MAKSLPDTPCGQTCLTSYRWVLGTALFIVSTVSLAQSATIDRAKAAMEGNWRLEEWQTDEEPLRPPQADGRLSLHDGVIMVLMHRDSQGTRKSFYEYGTYSLSDATWTYGYDRYVVFTDNGSSITAGSGPFEGRRTYVIKAEGSKLVLDNDNGRWMLIFDGDTLTYLDKGRPLRKWRRMASD